MTDNRSSAAGRHISTSHPSTKAAISSPNHLPVPVWMPAATSKVPSRGPSVQSWILRRASWSSSAAEGKTAKAPRRRTSSGVSGTLIPGPRVVFTAWCCRTSMARPFIPWRSAPLPVALISNGTPEGGQAQL